MRIRTGSYWHLLINLVKRNIKLKYKGSILGYFWSLISPLVYLAVFHFVFSHAFESIENYSLYVITGIVFWIFFANASSETVASFLRNGGIIKSIKLPIFIFPLSAVVTELISLFFALISFSLLMVYLGFQASWATLLIIPFLILFSLFILGFSTFLATLNVYFRDISILWNTILPILFYFSPIAFSNSLIPEKYQWILMLNPLYFYFETIHKILYENIVPAWDLWLPVILYAGGTFILGIFTLKKLEPGLVSNI